MKRLLLILALAMLVPARTSWAQLAPPNQMGVAMGHVHLIVQDVDTYTKFFMTLGAAPTSHMNGVKFPGVVILFRKGDPSGPAVGTVIGHFGFHVPDTKAALDRWSAAGLKTEVGPNPGQGFVYTPDNLIRIEILEDKTLTVPIAFHHIHYFVPERGPGGASGVKEIQAWYAQVFGAKPGMRAQFEAADLPGVNLTFSQSDTPTKKIEGSVIDHIGFDMTDLEGFCKKESALGVKFDSPCTKDPNKPLFTIYLTDPWGTKIELTNDLRTF